MGRNIEIEFKNMVSKENFNKILHFFQVSEKKFITQKNHYFDTEDLSLGKRKSALRIREVNNGFELTFKKAVEVGVLEVNQSVSFDQAQALLKEKTFPPGEVRDELLLMGISPAALDYKGLLQTDRAELPFKHGQLMFDHSKYLGKEDFEVEFEVDKYYLSQGESDFYRLFHELNIPFIKADNKIKRFFDAKKEG
ncbi:adenylate cyclase [Bacillus freudenreichii]|nr:adenylate cyclase [Bacillus freudenreichii]